MAADLTFQQLSAGFGDPAAVTIAGNTIVFDAEKCMGELAIAAADMKVAEFFTVLLTAANTAQIAYNADPGNASDLNSYPAPFSGVPELDATDGKFYVTETYSFQSRSPLDRQSATAVTA
ncbi:hypothetical protein [Pseudanabaena sp. PCC 6802]|uniref:hypothetical protein n=1 Tax=Pseudanabaena sp. PCC 6802 TaxID=118173 RepID=UPI000346E2A8|nr:hypothetical protein [Pseudanabaena sp. PCC 6802]